MTVFAAFAPRIAHAVTATLVQVVNGASNPVMSRNIDEPARVPYQVTATPTCTGNFCLLTGTAVPAGMRLHVTRISGAMSLQPAFANGIVALVDSSFNPLIFFPLSTFEGAFFGFAIGFDHPVDYYFDEGQLPQIEIGAPCCNTELLADGNLSIVGYVVPKQP
jgi:hypothetical protein